MRLNFLTDFFRDLGNFFDSGSVLGIDVGTSSIKAVELAKKKEELILQNYAILETKSYLERSKRALQTSSLKVSESDGAYLLKTIFNEMKPKARVAIMSLPAFSSFVTVIDMPLLPNKETDNAIAYQARQYIPVNISEVYIEWFRIEEFQGEGGSKSQRVMLIGTPKDLIETYKAIAKKAGVKIAALEIESIALARACRGITSSPTLLIDLGAQSSNIIVAESGIFTQGGGTDYGGVHLSNALARSLGVSVYRAEELKRRRGLLGGSGEMELSTSMVPFLDVIIQEVRHVQMSYERRAGKKVEKFILLGGGGNLEGAERHFENELKLKPATPPMLFGLSTLSEVLPLAPSLTKPLAVSIGLARKYFEN